MALTDVQIGMKVIDSAGHEIGTVQEMKIGDPQAATAEGQSAPQPLTSVGFSGTGLCPSRWTAEVAMVAPW